MCVYTYVSYVCSLLAMGRSKKHPLFLCFIYLSSYILWQLTYEIVAQKSSGLLYYCKRSTLALPIFTHHFVSTMLSARFIFNCQFYIPSQRAHTYTRIYVEYST